MNHWRFVLKNKTGLIMKIFVLTFGVFSLIYGIKFMSVQTADLVEVEAEILSSTWGTIDDLGNDSYNITYSYSVMGVNYEGSFSGSEGYTQGEKITVYYDPQSPENTYSSQGESTLLGIIGIVFGLFCVGSILWGMIRPRGRNSNSVETPPAL